MTLKQCQNECSNTKGCKGIEYFRPSGHPTASNIYEENDCNLSSGLDISDCDSEKW